tara:strand:- start:1701 stop:1865 length:165 start_codon:yes stop_codon:yes gene_type:complete
MVLPQNKNHHQINMRDEHFQFLEKLKEKLESKHEGVNYTYSALIAKLAKQAYNK